MLINSFGHWDGCLFQAGCLLTLLAIRASVFSKLGTYFNKYSIHMYFPFKQFGIIFLLILDSLQCVIKSYILTTKQLIMHYCKKKIDVDKHAGAKRILILKVPMKQKMMLPQWIDLAK